MTRPVLVLVDAPRTLAGVAFAGLWLADRLAALAPSVVVTSTTHGPNEDAARYAYACGIRLALYETSGRITGTTDAGRWTPAPCPGRGASGDEWVAWYNRRALVMASQAARRIDRYDVTVLAPRASHSHVGKSFSVQVARALGLVVEEEAWDVGAPAADFPAYAPDPRGACAPTLDAGDR